MMRRIVTLAAALAALTLVPAPAQAAETFIVASPGSFVSNYATPAATMHENGALTFVSVDVEQHDVVHDVDADGISGPSDRPWCTRFPEGECPLFWSDAIFVLGERTTPVLGTDALEAGNVYSFYCSFHPSMKGKLVVAPSP